VYIYTTQFSTKSRIMCVLAIHLHNNGTLGAWKQTLLKKMGFKVQGFENDALPPVCKQQKREFVKNGDMSMCITCWSLLLCFLTKWNRQLLAWHAKYSLFSHFHRSMWTEIVSTAFFTTLGEYVEYGHAE